MPWRCGRCWPDCPAGRPGVSPALLHYSLFTLTFFGNKALTCRLVRDAPPSSSSPCGEEEERRARCRRRRGLGCKLSRYRAPISALLRGGNCSAVWCKLDLLQRLRPLARWLGACSGLLSSRHGSARKAQCIIQLHVCKHQGSGSGKRRTSHSSLYQTCTRRHIAQTHLTEARVHLRLYPKPLFFSFAPGAARFFFSCREKKKWGAQIGQGGKLAPCKRIKNE